MNLKSVGKIIKSIIDKRNPLLDQRLIHIVSENKTIIIKATSGSAVLSINTGIKVEDNSFGYLDPDSICGMSNYYPDMSCISFIKNGIKFINPIESSFKSGNAYYISKSELEGNFYQGLIQSNGSMKEIYNDKIDLDAIKKLSHSSKCTDVFGYSRMCAAINNHLYTFRHTSMSRISFCIKDEAYFDYKDIAAIQYFDPENSIKIESDKRSIILSQDNISLCIIKRKPKKNYAKSFEKSFSGKNSMIITTSRKDFKEKLVQIKRICKNADCKIKIKDSSIELEAVYGSGRAKQETSSYSSVKIKTPITCKTSIDLLLDFIRCGKSESVEIDVVTILPFNNYLKLRDDKIEELIALRNDGKLA
jgi:hypothetical protein